MKLVLVNFMLYGNRSTRDLTVDEMEVLTDMFARPLHHTYQEPAFGRMTHMLDSGDYSHDHLLKITMREVQHHHARFRYVPNYLGLPYFVRRERRQDGLQYLNQLDEVVAN